MCIIFSYHKAKLKTKITTVSSNKTYLKKNDPNQIEHKN